MAIILLVVTKRADFPRADWRALAEHQIEVIHASSQARAWEAIAQAQPDFVLLAAAATRLVTRPFIEKVRQLAPEAGLMGLADAEWPLAPLLDHLLPPSATDWGRDRGIARRRNDEADCRGDEGWPCHQ